MHHFNHVSFCLPLHHCHVLYVTLQIPTPVYFPDTHLCIFGKAPPSLFLFRNITRKGDCIQKLHLQCSNVYCDWHPSVMPCNASCTLKACEDYGCAPSAAGPCPCWWRWSWTGDSGHVHNPGGSHRWHLASHKCTQKRVCLGLSRSWSILHVFSMDACMNLSFQDHWTLHIRINSLMHNFKDSWNLLK